MATRMQQRRGTAAQWVSTNSGNGPVLAPGEIGYESDTNKFKIGDGTNHWINLDYFMDADSTTNPQFGSSIKFEGATANAFETTLEVAEPTADNTITLPNASGTVVLANSATGAVTISGDLTVSGTTTTINSTTINATTGLVFEGTTANDYETTISVIDPTADRAIEFPDAAGTVALISDVNARLSKAGGQMTGSIDLNLATKIINMPVPTADTDGASKVYVDTADALKAPLNSPTFTGTVTLPNLTSIGDVSSTEIGYVNGVTSAIQTQLDAKQAVVANVSDTEISYLDGVTSGIQAQLGTKQAIVANVSDTEIGYLDGVTSAIQTQLDSKRSTGDSINLAATKVIIFEGTTNDEYETTLTVTDPTADREITFPNATGTVVLHDASQTLTNKTFTSPKINEDVVLTATATELNILDGVTSTAAELNILDGVTSTAAELNILDGATLTVTELNYVDGVTSAIQTQIDTKAPTSGPTFTGTVILPSTTSIGDVSSTEIGYVDGVTSAIQTQLDAKAPLAAPAFTGTATAVNLTVSGDLTVSGTTTNINSTNLVVEDKNVVLGDVTTPTDTTADGGGITLKGATDKTFNWVDATDSWTSSEHINLASGKDLKVNGTSVISTTAGGFIFTDGTQTKEGVPSRTSIIQKTAAYTLSAANERDSLIEVSHTGGSAVTISIPTDATFDFPIGTSIDILRTNTGEVTIAAVTPGTTTVNATPGLKLRDQWSSATLFKRAANLWIVMGDLKA